MKTFIVRFKGTPPNHHDAPPPQLISEIDKATAIANAHWLAEEKGWQVSSVRAYFKTHTTKSKGKP